MDLDYKGRPVIVTGGTGALGTAVVGLLLARGAECTVPCVRPEELRRFPYRAEARVHIVEGAELSDEASVRRLYARGPVWASIHIAGGFGMAPITETSLDQYRAMMDTNALTCFLCSREAVRAMRAGGGGRIVNVAARPALIPEQGAGMVAYTAAKGAVAALTRALAAEVVSEGILVNAVVPSIMDTPANRAAMPAADHGAWPRVEEVAQAIAFLASPANTVTRGALVPVYGRA